MQRTSAIASPVRAVYISDGCQAVVFNAMNLSPPQRNDGLTAIANIYRPYRAGES